MKKYTLTFTEDEINGILDALNYATEYFVRELEVCPFSKEKNCREKLAEIDELIDTLYTKKRNFEKVLTDATL